MNKSTYVFSLVASDTKAHIGYFSVTAGNSLKPEQAVAVLKQSTNRSIPSNAAVLDFRKVN